MNLDWSPADLGRQRQIVRALARRAETDRLRLQAKRRKLMNEVTGTLSSPAGLAGCFLVGFVVGVARRRAPAAGNGIEARTAPRQKLHPLRLLIGAWLWLRRGHAHLDAREGTASPEPMFPEPHRPAIPPSEYIH